MIFREFVKHTFRFLVEAVLSVLSSVETWMFRTMIWHQRPLSIIYDILSLTNSTLLTADMILLCTKKNLYLSNDSRSPFRRKMCITSPVRCHRPPIWLPALPLNLTYLDNSLESVIMEPALYKPLNSIIQISCPYSIAWVVYPENPSRSETL
jgi:hypothetical protein